MPASTPWVGFVTYWTAWTVRTSSPSVHRTSIVTLRMEACRTFETSGYSTFRPAVRPSSSAPSSAAGALPSASGGPLSPSGSPPARLEAAVWIAGDVRAGQLLAFGAEPVGDGARLEVHRHEGDCPPLAGRPIADVEFGMEGPAGHQEIPILDPGV